MKRKIVGYTLKYKGAIEFFEDADKLLAAEKKILEDDPSAIVETEILGQKPIKGQSNER